MFSAHAGGEPSEGAQKEAANCASRTGPDARYNDDDDDTPPDSEVLWSLSCGSPTLRSSVSRQRRLTKEIEAAPVLLRTIASKEKEGGSPGSLLRRALSGSASANASGSSGSGSPVDLRPPARTGPSPRALWQAALPPGYPPVLSNLPEVERPPEEERCRPTLAPPSPRPRPAPSAAPAPPPPPRRRRAAPAQPYAAPGRTILASAAIGPPFFPPHSLAPHPHPRPRPTTGGWSRSRRRKSSCEAAAALLVHQVLQVAGRWRRRRQRRRRQRRRRGSEPVWLQQQTGWRRIPRAPLLVGG